MIQHQCDVCSRAIPVAETYGIVLDAADQPPRPQGFSHHWDERNVVVNVQVANPRQLCGSCLALSLKNLLEERFDATVSLPTATDPYPDVRSLPSA